jgi:hypothetical protein
LPQSDSKTKTIIFTKSILSYFRIGRIGVRTLYYLRS